MTSAACWTILEIVFCAQTALLRRLDKLTHWNRRSVARLPGPPRSPMRTDVSRSLRNSPQFAGVSAGSNADVRSLPLAEVAIASILAAGLWALQTRSWRATELHMKTARFKSTSRASRIGGTTRQEHRGGE